MDSAGAIAPGQTLSAEHRVEKWGPFSVVGAGVDCVNNDTSPIAKLWGETFDTLPRPEGFKSVVGVCYDLAGDTWRYMAAFLVDHTTKAPEGTEKKTFPATKFAIWEFAGTPPQMAEAFREIFTNRLPALGLESQKGGVCLEIYPPEPMGSDGLLHASICVPIV